MSLSEKRRAVKLTNNGYNLLKEIQKKYTKEIGFSPTLSQLLEMSISKLCKTKEEELEAKKTK